jgi:hypothetical protein
MHASAESQLECARVLLEAGASVMQLNNYGSGALHHSGTSSLGMLQLLCAYAPSRESVCAQLARVNPVKPEYEQWLDATRRWTSQLHHFEFLSIERVRALLAKGADVHAADGGADAPTPLSLAAARLLRGNRSDDGYAGAALIVSATTPWSPWTHALFPAGAKARAVELVRIGWLLARRLQDDVVDARQVEGSFRDAWLGVMAHAIERSSA